MASISRALQRIKRDLHQLIPAEVIERICRDLDYRYRKRKLDPLTTIHLFVQQVLNGNTAVTELPILSGLEFDESSYCDARARLPLQVLQKLLRHTADALRNKLNGRGLWEGHRVWLVDGSGCSMPDTPALQKEFGQSGKQKEGCGFPVAHLLALFDAYSGMVLEMVAAPLRTHDLSEAWALHPLMRPGDVLVGDRAFCSYAHLAALHERGIHAVVRLHQRIIVRFRDQPERNRPAERKGEPRSRLVRKLGHQDQLVEWYKPQKKPEYLTQEEYDALPATLIVRELHYRIADEGCRTHEVTLVTTLLDPRKYTKRKLAKLFQVRWRVEENLKSLKITLKIDVLKCKTPDGVRKELAVFGVVYNLVCMVREMGARQQGVPPERISFINVLRWLKKGKVGTKLPRFIVNPLRPGRHEPRLVKRRPKSYKRMTKPRAHYKRGLS
jgi:hypothetical protein